MLNSFDIDQDFHTVNPHVKVLIPETKDVPSSHLWGLLLFAHPDSKLFNESPNVRKKLVLEYLKDDTFSFDSYRPLLSLIETKLLTKAQKSLMQWETTLNKRDDYIAGMEYSSTNWQMLDKMLTDTPKLWDQYEGVMEKLNKEKAKTFGDQEESLSEKGVI